VEGIPADEEPIDEILVNGKLEGGSELSIISSNSY
jgi:hypothetical protein